MEKALRLIEAKLRYNVTEGDVVRLPSAASDDKYHSEDAKDYYTSEGCPHHAIALHRRTGYPIHMMRDERSGDIAHVYVKHPDGSALDVHGKRPVSALNNHWHDVDPVHHEVGTEKELRKYMGDSDDKPLYAHSEDEVGEADRHIQKHQRDLLK